MTIELTCDLVRTWLADKKDRESVGTPGISSDCPLATCLAANGAPNPRVYADGWYDEWDYKISPPHPTPDWAAAFITKVDKLADQVEYITARRAKSILREVCPKTSTIA